MRHGGSWGGGSVVWGFRGVAVTASVIIFVAKARVTTHGVQALSQDGE